MRMNLDEIPQMNKTQMNMYSTLAPVGRSLVRQQFPTGSRTSRYRFTSSTKPYNPQTTNLSCAISKQHRTQAKIGVLPNIKREKGFMLQQWLNDALQGEQGLGIKQPLKTLKKYEMDKGTLRNANLSNEQINSLYNGLFVYTSGIKNTFQQMLKGASSQNRDDNRLQKTYWKIFIKLLENTIPVKTCFQIIEDEYRRQIVNLKHNLLEQHQKEEKISQEYEQKIKRLKKDIEQSNKKFAQYEQQYKVMNANLIMYQQTFNDEVSLRLKFQQKINQVYTSYGQLKEKFEAVKVQLNYKAHQLVEAQLHISQHQRKVANEQIKNQDVIRRLRQAQQKLSEKQEEIIIKNQEISDIRVQSQTEEQKKKSQQIALDQLISTIKLLKKAQVQHEKKVQQLRGVISVQENTINKLKETLSNSREKNDQMYMKYRQSVLKHTQIEQSKSKQCFQLETTKSKAQLAENKLSILKTQKQELSSKVSKLQLECQFKNKQIIDKDKTIQIFNKNIAQLKATKDKYERLNSHLRIQLQKNKDQIGNKTNQLNIEMTKVCDISYQLEKYTKKNTENQTTILILKDQLKAKDVDIKNLNQMYKIKLSTMQGKIKEKQYQIHQKNRQISSMKQEMDKKDAQKLDKFEQLTFLHKHNTQLLKQVKQNKDKVYQLIMGQQATGIQISTLKKKLQSKQFTLDKKKDEVNSQIINLRQSLFRLKFTYQNRRQYVHPMLLQDYAAKINRYQQKIKQIKSTHHHKNSMHDSLVSQLQKIKLEKQALIQEKIKMNQSYQMLMKDSAKRQDQKKNLKNQFESKIKEKEAEIMSIKDGIKAIQDNYKTKISQKMIKIQQLTKINQKLTAQTKRFQQMEAKRKNCKEIGTQSNPINKSDILVQTDALPQNISNNPANQLKKKTFSLRQSQHSLQRQQKGLQRPTQRQYDKIVDQRQIESTLRNDGYIISQEQKEDNQKRQQKTQRKIQGKQFKKALRMTFIRR